MKHSKLTKEFNKGWAHFCKCVNWNQSALDAEAIEFMNEMPGRLCRSHDALLKACKVALEFFVLLDVSQKTISGISLQLNEVIKEVEK